MNKFAHQNSSLTYHPELGWLISWLMIDSQEILYCDEASLNSWSIRWWIPTMLPNPWVGDWILPRHGIVRTAQFIAKEYDSNLTLKLDRNQSTILSEQYEVFPHDFVYDLTYNFIDHGCVVTQQVTNPVSHLSGRTSVLEWVEGLGVRMWFGLHPYFPTPLSIQQTIWWVTQDITIDHHNDDTQVLKNPWIIALNYPSYRLCIEYSDIYPRVWIWAPPWHNAICIEPVTHDVGDYFINPIIIAPWKQITGTMKFMIETVN